LAERSGERRGERTVPISEAAAILGISKDAVRMRVKRGTLRSEKRDGRVYVHLNDVPDADADADPNALVDDLRDQVAYLRGQLDVRAEEIRRRDIIVSQLTQATSNLTDRLRELTEGDAPTDTPAPSPASSEPSETASETAANASPGPRPPAGGTGAQNGSERMGWWRRIFGG